MSSKKQRIFRSTLKPATSIIVPVLDEADNILPLVKRVRKAVARRELEVLFIVDGPDQKTIKRVEEARTIYRSNTFDVRSYHRSGKKRWGGLSGAVADGIARAKSDRIIVMDGDLQHPPEIIPDVIDASQNKDVVVASRYLEGGSTKGLDGGIRHLVSHGSKWAAKLFFPFRLRKVSDPMTGFFFINRQKVKTDRLHPKGFKILLEILATHPKLSCVEVPLQFAERKNGKSHGTVGRGLEFLSQLITLRFGSLLNTFNRQPKFIQFGFIGGSVFAIGMLLLYSMVEVLDWPPLLANAIQLAVTFWLNYWLNRKITWRERTVSRLSGHKFLVSRFATTILNYLLFVWLITQPFSISVFSYRLSFSVNYLAANFITLALITIINFVVSDRWAFAEVKRKTKTLPRSVSPSLFLVILLFLVINFSLGFSTVVTISFLMVMVTLVLFVQSSMEIWRVMYAYRDPESIDRLRFPAPTALKEKFCLLVPARHEATVLATTLRKLARQTHPNATIITVICDDDLETLEVARSIEQSETRVRVISYPLSIGDKPSKPKQLNYAFNQIKVGDYTVIGVIDAEDTVHEELLTHVDAAFRQRGIGIVQGGVQLMDHDSSWYSLHNVLEYYRWYNSTMSFQADNKFMPLGGNTVFIRERLLRRAGGWPETLTEDCSLGVLLSTRFKAKTAVYYEPRLATGEETPSSLKALFRQRVRWNQGFFHEWRKGVWQDLPTHRQRLLADYVLISPILLATISLLIPAALLSFLFLAAPVGLVMLMYLPLIPATLHLVFSALLLRDFGKVFERKVSPRHYLILITTQIPYQLVLNTAAFWAVLREMRGEHSWDKTPHLGKHRTLSAKQVVDKAGIHFIEEPGDA